MINKFLFIKEILVICLITVFYFSYFVDSIEKKNIDNNLKNLSDLEKEYLNNLFQYVVRVSSFGYVIFGDKPMSIETYNDVNLSKNIDGIDYMDDEHLIDKYRLKEGWLVWKKYEHLFKLDNFTFISYPSVDNIGFIEICLINNQKFVQIIKNNLSDFQTILKNKWSAEEIFYDYIHQGASFLVIRKHDGLFGTLLGYGRNNAWAFYEQKDRRDRNLELFNNENMENVRLILLPMFMSLPNTKETKRLKKKYYEQRKLFEPLYFNGSYVNPSLEGLMQ